MEFEYDIPFNQAQLIIQSSSKTIVKTRYLIPIKNIIWELDIFHDKNDGLILAEVELKSETQQFDKPSWLRNEVSLDFKYTNVQLIKNPFSQWSLN